MQNTFGLKDFVLLVLVSIVGVIAVLGMQQSDRVWNKMEQARKESESLLTTAIQIRGEMEQLRSQQREALRDAVRDELTVIDSKIDAAMAAAATSGAAVSTGGPTSTAGASWARPGYPVTYPEPERWVSDPRKDADFNQGGELFEIFEAQMPKISPFLYSDVYGRRIVEGAVCECLGAYDAETLKLRGALAEAWQYDPNGMWLRVKIHDRARFSDGRPVTAEDVRWTFHDFVFNPELETERFRSTLNVIDHVEVLSEKVCEFHFVDPMFTNLREAVRMPILPKHFYEQFTPTQLNQSTGLLMGSGPYRLENLDVESQWAPPQDLVLVRNENYWREPPPYHRQRYKTIDNYAAILTSLENGTGDIGRGTPEQFREKSRDKGFTDDFHALQWANMRSGFSFIAWNCGERNGKLTPFADKRVRQAMAHLLDCNRIRRDFYYGLGQICTGPFPVGSPQNSTDIVPLEYSVEKARQLLTEAGWIDRNGDGIVENERGDRFTFEYVHGSGSTISPKIGNYLRDQCALVGVECVPKPIDWAIFQTTLNQRDFDCITMQWSQSNPESDPYQLWHSKSIENQGDNFSQWANPEADRLIELGRRTLDFEQRMAVWHQLQQVIYDDQPYTFILNAPWIRFINKRVGNVHPYPIGIDKTEMFPMP
ncbi:MAG: hypothetical protein KDA20_02855 [Phycisphaerales bacterium]|nr:hypothetical protein [Phycisphaerales bacterium]